MKWISTFILLFSLAMPLAFALPADVQRIVERIKAQNAQQEEASAHILKLQQRIELQKQQNKMQLAQFKKSLTSFLKLQNYAQPWHAITHPEQAPLIRFAQKNSQANLVAGEERLNALFKEQRALRHSQARMQNITAQLMKEREALMSQLKIKDKKLRKRLKQSRISKPRTSKNVKSVARPIEGILLTAFNAQDANGIRGKGVTLQGNAQGLVRAIAAGTVLYTGTFRDYGGLMIVVAGDKQYIYGGLTDYRQKVGSQVKKGDKLALLSAQDAPKLYLEVRHNNREIDPWPLIKK